MPDRHDDADAERNPSADRVSRLVANITDGPPNERVAAAYELDEIAEARPSDVVAVVPSLRTALAAEDGQVRAAVAVVLSTVGASEPAAVEPAADDLSALLADAEPTANNALSPLLQLLQEDQEAALSALVPRLDDVVSLARAETPVIRQRAAWILLAFAESRPAALEETDAVPTLAGILERPGSATGESVPSPTDGPKQRFSEFVGRQAQRDRSRRGTGRRVAAAALARLAAARPSALEGTLRQVLAHLDDDDPAVRVGVCSCLGEAAVAVPAVARDAVPSLVDALFDPVESARVRAAAATALGLVAEVDADSVASEVAPHGEALASLLDADDDGLRGGATGLLAYLAEHDPALAEPARDRLRVRLDDDQAFVRGNAATSLGFLGDEGAKERIAERRDSDPKASVRRVAAEAVRRIDRSH